jgi:hypothetical protein
LHISYDNVRKRISQARVILQQKWYEYEGEGKKDISLSTKKRKCKTVQKRIEKEIEVIECEEKILVESEKETEIEKPEIVIEFEEEKSANCVVEKEDNCENIEEINVKENNGKNKNYQRFKGLIMIKIAHILDNKMFFCSGYLRRLGGFNKGIDSS